MSTLFSQENILFFDLFFSPHECEFAAYIVRIYARKLSISKNGHEIRSPSHPLNVWNWLDMALQKPKASLSIFSYYKWQVYHLFFILHALPIESYTLDLNRPTEQSAFSTAMLHIILCLRCVHPSSIPYSPSVHQWLPYGWLRPATPISTLTCWLLPQRPLEKIAYRSKDKKKTTLAGIWIIGQAIKKANVKQRFLM